MAPILDGRGTHDTPPKSSLKASETRGDKHHAYQHTTRGAGGLESARFGGARPDARALWPGRLRRPAAGTGGASEGGAGSGEAAKAAAEAKFLLDDGRDGIRTYYFDGKDALSESTGIHGYGESSLENLKKENAREADAGFVIPTEEKGSPKSGGYCSVVVSGSGDGTMTSKVYWGYHYEYREATQDPPKETEPDQETESEIDKIKGWAYSWPPDPKNTGKNEIANFKKGQIVTYPAPDGTTRYYVMSVDYYFEFTQYWYDHPRDYYYSHEERFWQTIEMNTTNPTIYTKQNYDESKSTYLMIDGHNAELHAGDLFFDGNDYYIFHPNYSSHATTPERDPNVWVKILK